MISHHYHVPHLVPEKLAAQAMPNTLLNGSRAHLNHLSFPLMVQWSSWNSCLAWCASDMISNIMVATWPIRSVTVACSLSVAVAGFGSAPISVEHSNYCQSSVTG